jgi:Arc/MetJ family transcription regulator
VYGHSLMRTNIVLDGDLVAEAMRRTGIKTRRAVVEEALRTLIGRNRQEEFLALRGKLHWEGDLDRMRRDGARACLPPARAIPARPCPFGDVAGTDSHGPMDHPNKALTRKG